MIRIGILDVKTKALLSFVRYMYFLFGLSLSIINNDCIRAKFTPVSAVVVVYDYPDL